MGRAPFRESTTDRPRTREQVLDRPRIDEPGFVHPRSDEGRMKRSLIRRPAPDRARNMARNIARTVALGRHAGTELPGSGASPGTAWLFASLEQSLARHVSVMRVPPYYPLDARGSLRIAIDVLQAADACVFGVPRQPTDLDAFFAVRARIGRTLPFLYLPLGEFPRGAWFYRHLYRHLGAQDALLFSSSADFAIFERLVAATPARTLVVPFGIEAGRFQVAPERRAAVRRQLGIAPDEVVFVYHGRVCAEKNLQATIRLVQELILLGLPVRLWVIGPIDGDTAPAGSPRDVSQLPEAPLVGEFARLLPTPTLRERVGFWGAMAHEALPELLAAADVGINLTLNPDENFGYGVVEAMAAGLPVIGSDWGGLKDTIAEGLTGYRVPTAINPTGIALDHSRARQCGIALAADAERRARMGRAAARGVAERFTLERFGDAVARQLETQLHSAPPATPVSHAWTPLGQRLVDGYSTPLADGPFASLPLSVPPSANLLAEHPLMREVLAPYASGDCSSASGDRSQRRDRDDASPPAHDRAEPARAG